MHHSDNDADGFKCGEKYCLDTDILCSMKWRFDKEALNELSNSCLDLVSQINNPLLCTNQTFWKTRPCKNGSYRCSGNFPGQCAENAATFKYNYISQNINHCTHKSDFKDVLSSDYLLCSNGKELPNLKVIRNDFVDDSDAYK